MTEYCVNCGEPREYEVETRPAKGKYRKINYEFVEKVAICKTCGALMYVPELNDANAEAAEAAYKKAVSGREPR